MTPAPSAIQLLQAATPLFPKSQFELHKVATLRVCCLNLMLLVSLAGVLTVSGCATHAQRMESVRSAFYSGRIEQAESIVEREISSRQSNVDALKLNRAILQLADGRPRDAERTLREVRDRFDHLEQKDVSESILSTVSDDNRLAYSGEDYEKVLVRCFLALSNLMADGEDASAYALQVGDKQRQIIFAEGESPGDNPRLAYKRVALGAYIHGAIQEATHTNYDEAMRAIQLVASWEPSFKEANDDLQRVTSGHHSKAGNGVLYVFTMVGRGPYKEERSETPTSSALLIADRILTATSKYSLPPTIAPIKVPVVVRSPNRIDSVLVETGDGISGVTRTITDVGQLAVDQYAAIFPRVMARAVVRRVVKKGAIYATKAAANIDDPLASFAMDAVGVAWEASESADTRCWGLLPDRIQVTRLELPAGEHVVKLTPS
ncbi:MAG: hypothetical protein O3B13_15255, partial [Planctomycetota bacterium]|nr:hypothetical protein [Planctomycetota bacterium]